jgi:hypothetical protein
MRGRAGQPPKTKTVSDPALVCGQVEKKREGRKVVKVEKKLVLGTGATELAYISTSLLERQNWKARSQKRYRSRDLTATLGLG